MQFHAVPRFDRSSSRSRNSGASRSVQRPDRAWWKLFRPRRSLRDVEIGRGSKACFVRRPCCLSGGKQCCSLVALASRVSPRTSLRCSVDRNRWLWWRLGGNMRLCCSTRPVVKVHRRCPCHANILVHRYRKVRFYRCFRSCIEGANAPLPDDLITWKPFPLGFDH
jgi:hypothetical protein